MTYTGTPPSVARAASRPSPCGRSPARQPARPTKQIACGRSHAHSAGRGARPRAVLRGGEVRRPGGGPLHDVGHADAVAGRAGGAGRGRARSARRRGAPARTGCPGDVADAGVGGVQRRVEPAAQQAHPAVHVVGQRPDARWRWPRCGGCDRRRHRSIDSTTKPAPTMASVNASGCHQVNRRPGRSSSGGVMSVPSPANMVSSNRPLDGERVVDVGERHGQLLGEHVLVRLARPHAREGAAPERQVEEVGAHHRGVRGVPAGPRRACWRPRRAAIAGRPSSGR